MGGAACVIIIIGNELSGSVAGIYDLISYDLAEAQNLLTEQEKAGLATDLRALQDVTAKYVERIRGEGGIDLQLITHGAQIMGNLNALCETAATSPLKEYAREQMVEILEAHKRKAEEWLKLIRKRAEKTDY